MWAESLGVHAADGENGENSRRTVVFAWPGKLGNIRISPDFILKKRPMLNKAYRPENGMFLFALTGAT